MAKLCPTCGRPMRIKRDTRGGHARRIWRCPNWSSLGRDTCLTEYEVDPDEQLSTQDIAEDMAREAFGSSQEQGRKQASFRRIAGMLNNMEGLHYLAEDELQALKAAAAVCERLGSASERAKKAKKRIEDEEAQRQAQRRRALDKQIEGLFTATDLVTLAANTLALRQIENRHAPWQAGWVKSLQRKLPADTTLLDVVTREIRLEFDDACRHLAGSLAWRDEPVERLMRDTQQQFETARDYVFRVQGTVLDELREMLAVESGANIVRLHHGAGVAKRP